MKVKKVFVSLLLTFVLLSSVVFATDVMPISVEPEKIVDITVQEPSTTASNSQAKEINEDKYIYNTDSYSISDIVYGNIFYFFTQQDNIGFACACFNALYVARTACQKNYLPSV